jgi:hypothetical protein
LTKPDPPINLANNALLSSGDTISIFWSAGAMDGGTPVIDYTVSYDSGLGTSVYTVLASSVATLFYTKTGVTSGVSYIFTVQARNAFGLSDYSTTLVVLAAQTPNQPAAPVTSNYLTTNIKISWTAPENNGSPIFAYQVLIRRADSAYALDTINCDGSDPDIVSAVSCVVPVSALIASPFNHVYGNSIYAIIIATNGYGNSV